MHTGVCWRVCWSRGLHRPKASGGKIHKKGSTFAKVQQRCHAEGRLPGVDPADEMPYGHDLISLQTTGTKEDGLVWSGSARSFLHVF